MADHRIEPLWDAQLAIGAAIALDASLPGGLVLRERWIAPVLSGVLLAALAFATLSRPRESRHASRRLHALALTVLAIVLVFDLGSLTALIVDIVTTHGHRLSGGQLLRGSAQVWVATVLLFAVVFWQLDRGGPLQRSADGPQNIPPHRHDFSGRWPDFYFPQMQDDCPAPANWMPAFADYLYVAATNSTAYSPTDTMPLTRVAKAAMVIQSGSSFVLFALVLGRAVSLLG